MNFRLPLQKPLRTNAGGMSLSTLIVTEGELRSCLGIDAGALVATEQALAVLFAVIGGLPPRDLLDKGK